MRPGPAIQPWLEDRNWTVVRSGWLAAAVAAPDARHDVDDVPADAAAPGAVVEGLPPALAPPPALDELAFGLPEPAETWALDVALVWEPDAQPDNARAKAPTSNKFLLTTD